MSSRHVFIGRLLPCPKDKLVECLQTHYGLTSGFMPSALFWCEVPAFYSEPPKGSLPLSSLLVPQLWRYRKPPVGRCQLYSSGTTFVVQGLNRVTSGFVPAALVSRTVTFVHMHYGHKRELLAISISRTFLEAPCTDFNI